MEKIRFDKVVDKKLLDKIHSEFRKHMKFKEVGSMFIDKLNGFIITDNEKLNLKKIFKNLEIDMTEQETMIFLEANCYQYLLPKMHNEGHEFSSNEKVFVAAFGMFQDCIGDKDYPYQTPEQQVDEYFSAEMSTAFIETCFQWNIEGLIKIYNDEFDT